MYKYRNPPSPPPPYRGGRGGGQNPNPKKNVHGLFIREHRSFIKKFLILEN
jgi:hypothetical protein